MIAGLLAVLHAAMFTALPYARRCGSARRRTARPLSGNGGSGQVTDAAHGQPGGVGLADAEPDLPTIT